MQREDDLFQSHNQKVKRFAFSQEVAQAFDDMVQRSVPFYREVHDLLGRILREAHRRRAPWQKIADLGCSTGTTIAYLARYFRAERIPCPFFLGLDSSPPMLEQAQSKIGRELDPQFFELRAQRLEEMELPTLGAAICNYTLQFLPVRERLDVLKSVARALAPGGLFFMAEKTREEDPYAEEIQTSLYYGVKKDNGYSQLEIARKREALTDFLVPLTPRENIELLREAGFTTVYAPFKWCSFSCFVGERE